MQEYWVNVYDFSFDPDKSKPVYSLGYEWPSREQAAKEYIKYLNKVYAGFNHMPIYRIHVKMKAPKGSNMEKRMANGAVEFAQIFKDAKKEFEEVVRDTSMGILDGYRSGY